MCARLPARQTHRLRASRFRKGKHPDRAACPLQGASRLCVQSAPVAWALVSLLSRSGIIRRQQLPTFPPIYEPKYTTPAMGRRQPETWRNTSKSPAVRTLLPYFPRSFGPFRAPYTILLIWPRVALLPGRNVLSEYPLII